MRVAIYARVSKPPNRKSSNRAKPEQNLSKPVNLKPAKPEQNPENQLRDLRAFCKTQEGWIITHEYVDRASAKSGDRAQFKKLFEDASRRQFDVLLFWAIDRLSREGTRKTLVYLERLTGWGIAWRSYQESFLDSLGPFADVVISVMATMAKLERNRISERTKSGLDRAREAGKKLGRPIVPVDLKQVQKLRRQGKSLRKIAAETKISLTTLCRAVRTA